MKTKSKSLFSGFVDEMIARVRKFEPDVKIKPADAIFRINKDIRSAERQSRRYTHGVLQSG